jgi:hypothetical protein
MKSKSKITLALAALTIGFAGTTRAHADVVTDWNAIAEGALFIPAAGRPGPVAFLDIAIVHAAVHDAVQAFDQRFEPYHVEIPGATGSPEAAVAKAAHDVLVNIVPAQGAALDAAYLTSLAKYGLAEDDPGVAVGQAAAAGILALRANDGRMPALPWPIFIGGTDPGDWRPTLPAFASMATPWLGAVPTFTIKGGDQYRPKPPPPLNSERYTQDYNEVKAVGGPLGSGTRTPEQTELAYFYGGFSWHKTLRDIADAYLDNIGDSARLLALANLSIADSVITAWESKVYFNFWRPITAIQEGDNDGNPATVGDPNWTPLFPTPPYPDYTSGFNNVAGALTRTLALFFGTDHATFSLTSTHPLATQKTRTLYRFSDLSVDAVNVRIYQGIHFRTADEEARKQGRHVAQWAFGHFLRPLDDEIDHAVSDWNVVAVQATLTAGENALVASRTLAIVQVAIHDALNAIEPRYERYAFTGDAETGASVEAAIAAAARDSLVGTIAVGALPFAGFGTPALQAQAVAQVDAAYTTALAGIPDGLPKSDGIAIGQATAAAILALRATDHATTLVTYTPGTRPGDWRPTPNPVPFDPPAAADNLPAVLPGWGQVTPFALRRSDQFEPHGPPRLSSEHYAKDYDEVKAIGAKNSATRTAEQSSIARFWYEGSPAGWSRIARTVAQSRGLNSWDTARLLALVNLAMADGFIAGFETKYGFNFWRPVTAIRAGDTDGNNATVADPTWSTFLNTPAVPDYTSTHSVLGGAAAEVLRRFFHDDDVPFTVTSGVPFAGLTRSFASFSQAAAENGESRIYAGIHFRSAVEDGIEQGKQIGHFAFTQALRPLDHGDDDDSDGEHGNHGNHSNHGNHGDHNGHQ